MAVEFRKAAGEEELVAALHAVESAFGSEANDTDVDRAKKTMPPDRVLVAVDEGRFVGVAASFPFSLTSPAASSGAAVSLGSACCPRIAGAASRAG